MKEERKVSPFEQDVANNLSAYNTRGTPFPQPNTPYVDPEISILDQHIQRWKEAADQLEAELAPDEPAPTPPPTLTPPTIPDLKTIKQKAKHHAASQPRPQPPVSPIQQTIVMGILADLERLTRANTQIRKVTLLLAINWAAALIALLLEITIGK